MYLYFLDSEFSQIDIADVFKSIIWTDRFSQNGDFELVTSPNSSYINSLINTTYISLPESDHLMILEFVNLVTDLEKGDDFIIKGRSLESILERRVVWYPTTLSGNLQTEVQRLLNENLINPIITARKIDDFIFTSSIDPNITSLEIEWPFFGETLYKAISDICISYNIGFKITMTPDFKFKFELYAGKDRSHDQLINPYVTFSPKMENLITSSYFKTDEFLRTVILIGAEKGVGNWRYRYFYDPSLGAVTGLNRRELYKEVNDISRNTETGQLSDSEYDLLLKAKAIDELSKNQVFEAFEGEVDPTKTFVLGEDFLIGDIVQVQDDYDHSSRSRIVEIIYSQSEEGIKIYPTFDVAF